MQQWGERRGRKGDRNSPADVKIGEEAGGRGTPGAGTEILLKPAVKTVVTQAVSLQHTEEHSEAAMKDSHWSRLISPGGSCSLQRERTTQEKVFSQELWPMGNAHWSNPLLKDSSGRNDPL